MTSMDSASQLHGDLRQHLVAFAERHYGGPLHGLRLQALRGGLQATGVFRVQAQYAGAAGRLRSGQCVVKMMRGEECRELAVYRTLQANAAEALAPRLLGVTHADTASLLFLEWVRPTRRWPWRDVHSAGLVLARLARLHQWQWTSASTDTVQWEYDHVLQQSGYTTLEALQRMVRDRGATQWWGAVPRTQRLVEALPELRRALLSAFQPVWIHGDVHPGNVIMRQTQVSEEPVLLDWARARPGSPLEDVSSWIQSLGHWEPQARRFHDTLLRTYLRARGLEPVLPHDFRRLYWTAGACNALAGALRYALAVAQSTRTPARQAAAFALVHQWLRLIRRADASWRAV